MDQIDTYVGYGALVCIVVFYVIYVIKYVKYWNQLQKAFLEAGIDWPFPSQETLNKEAERSIFGTQRMIWTAIIKTARVIFFMRTDNPAIQKPLRSIRRCFLALPIFFVLLAIILVVTTVLLGGV